MRTGKLALDLMPTASGTVNGSRRIPVDFVQAVGITSDLVPIQDIGREGEDGHGVERGTVGDAWGNARVPGFRQG